MEQYIKLINKILKEESVLEEINRITSSDWFNEAFESYNNDLKKLLLQLKKSENRIEKIMNRDMQLYSIKSSSILNTFMYVRNSENEKDFAKLCEDIICKLKDDAFIKRIVEQALNDCKKSSLIMINFIE